MTQLVQEKCVACRRDAPRVTEAEIAELHPIVGDWDLIDVDGVNRLRRSFRFRNFQQAMDFSIDHWEPSPKKKGHHPKLVTEWGRVTIDWWTHKIRGLHRNDFIMAAKTDRTFGEE